MSLSRSNILRASVGLAIGSIFGWPRAAIAAGAPTALQAQLLGRLAAFDRGFTARAGGVAKIACHYRAGDAESASVTNAVAKATMALSEVGGLRPDVSVAELVDPTKLAGRCVAEHLAILYFGPGTEGAMPTMAQSLASIDILTIGSSALHAERGCVVGLDVEEGRPKIVVNLRSARAQKVSFRAELLKLARVIE